MKNESYARRHICRRETLKSPNSVRTESCPGSPENIRIKDWPENNPVKKYILAALCGHEEIHQNQGSIDKDSTTVKVYASKHSNFSFKINESLSIRWDKLNRSFVLRCPYHFKMEIYLHEIKQLGNHDAALDPGTQLFLRLLGITILDQNGILFLFQPTLQWAKIFRVFHIETSNGLTLYFTKKRS